MVELVIMEDREPLSVKEQNALKTKKDRNDRCADCGKKFPIWVSLSYGIVVCLKCAGYHRGLGVHISRVRSIPLDSWSDRDKLCMKLGSNKRWTEALRRTNAPERLIPSVSSSSEEGGGVTFNAALCREKYTSNIAKSYREALKRNVSKASKKRQKRAQKINAAGEAEDVKCSSEPSISIVDGSLVDFGKDLPKRWISDPELSKLSQRTTQEGLEAAKHAQIRARFGHGGGGAEFERRRREQKARESPICGIL